MEVWRTKTALRLATAAVVAHAGVVAAHSTAHKALGVEPTQAQLAFIVIVIILAPLVAGSLAWTRAGCGRRRTW